MVDLALQLYRGGLPQAMVAILLLPLLTHSLTLSITHTLYPSFTHSLSLSLTGFCSLPAAGRGAAAASVVPGEEVMLEGGQGRHDLISNEDQNTPRVRLQLVVQLTKHILIRTMRRRQ